MVTCWMGNIQITILFQMIIMQCFPETSMNTSALAWACPKKVFASTAHFTWLTSSLPHHSACERSLVPQGGWLISYQSLKFVVEMRILAEMKMENHGKIYFPWKKNQQAYFFFLWKLRWWTCECKLKVRNWYSSWILVCYISSHLLPECLSCTDFSLDF